MVVTKDKLASLALFAVMAAVFITLSFPWGVPGLAVAMAMAVAAMGLVLIWFAEPLGEIGCFARGVAVHSPPQMIGAFGWLFLIGYPLLLGWVLGWFAS